MAVIRLIALIKSIFHFTAYADFSAGFCCYHSSLIFHIVKIFHTVFTAQCLYTISLGSIDGQDGVCATNFATNYRTSFLHDDELAADDNLLGAILQPSKGDA